MKDVRDATFGRADPELIAKLRHITVATACGSLMKMGFKNSYMMGISPLVPGIRVVGTAVTLRYLPYREDLTVTPVERANLPDFQAVEAMAPGDVIVADAAGDCGGSTFGDVILTRIKVRGGLGVVVDGAIRDLPFLKDMGMAVYAKGVHAAPGPRTIWPADWNLPIRCGGVLVMPGDVIIADEDGAVAIPRDAVAKVLELGLEEEELEAFVKAKLEAENVPVGVYYPPNPRTMADLEKARAEKAK